MKIFARVVHTTGLKSTSEVFSDYIKKISFAHVVETNAKVIIIKSNGMKIEYSIDEANLRD